MAAKTFTLTDNGTSSPQVLDSASLAMILTGSASGGNVTVEASADGTNYAPVYEAINYTNPALKINRVNNLSLPAGWRVRLKLTGAGASPSVRLTIE